jgi:tetratricopeptide (TPR) repeat protein
MTVVNSDNTTDYPTLFVGHILRSVARSMAAATERNRLPTAREREQALLTLSYAMKVDAAWLAARDLLLALAPVMEQAGHRDDWTPYLEQGIEISRQVGDPHTEAELRWHLGIILERRSHYDAAREELAASAARFAEIDDLHGCAKALNRMAFVACLQRQSDEASDLASISAQLLAEEDSERGYCDFVWGHVALDMRDWQAAHDYFRQALARWRSGGDRRMIAWGLSNLGMAMRRLNDHTGAQASFEEAIALFGDVDDPVHEAVARMNLGNVYLMTGHPQQALDHYLAAEPVFQLVQGTMRLATVYLNIGMAYRRLGQWADAQRTLQASIHLYEQLALPAAVANVIDELGLTYHDQGLLEQAVAEFEKAWRNLSSLPSVGVQLQSIEEHLEEARAAMAARVSAGGRQE